MRSRSYADELGPRAAWIPISAAPARLTSPSKLGKETVRGTGLIRPSRRSRFSSVGTHFANTSLTTSVGLSHDEVNRAMFTKTEAVSFRKGSLLLENLWCGRVSVQQTS